jgi:hypothetical protein
MRVFDNRMLRILFVSYRDEVTGVWRKLHNEELHDLLTHCCACYKIEKNEMGGACSAVGEERGVYSILVGKPEGKRPMGRPSLKWEDNIKMDLQ